ncbi:SRPBCC family protein [soil metagenome]|jgi:uncharacterized protein YndB with AHSA1/START domain
MRPATQGTESIHVDAPPERVYELVSDITRMGEWSPETGRCAWVNASGPAVGARFKASNRRGAARWSNTPQVIAAEPGREFAFRRVAPGAGEVDWRYRMEPAGAGTTLTESYEVVRPSPAIVNWVSGVLLRVKDRDADLAKGMRQTLEGIKRAAERQPDEQT